MGVPPCLLHSESYPACGDSCINLFNSVVYATATDVPVLHGSKIENVVPRRRPSFVDRTLIDPRFCSTSCLHTQSPRPVPTVPLVVKKGSKILFVVASAMPLPESATVIRTRRVPSIGSIESEARNVILPFWLIASRLFASRFASTCRSSPAIPITCSVSSHCCSTIAPLAL